MVKYQILYKFLQEYVDQPVTINLRPRQAETLVATQTGHQALVASVFVADDICNLFVEKNSYYAVKDLTQDTGFAILHCGSISSLTIGGMVLVPAEEETKYVQLQVSLLPYYTCFHLNPPQGS